MLDFICNYLGGESWTTQLPWSGQKQFNSSSYINWYIFYYFNNYIYIKEC